MILFPQYTRNMKDWEYQMIDAIRKAAEAINANGIKIPELKITLREFKMFDIGDSPRLASSDFAISTAYAFFIWQREDFVRYTIQKHGNFLHRFLLKRPRIWQLRIFNFMRPKSITKKDDMWFFQLKFRWVTYDFQEYLGRQLLINSVI